MWRHLMGYVITNVVLVGRTRRREVVEHMSCNVDYTETLE